MVSVSPLLTPQGHMFWNSRVFKLEKDNTVHMVYQVTLPQNPGQHSVIKHVSFLLTCTRGKNSLMNFYQLNEYINISAVKHEHLH